MTRLRLWPAMRYQLDYMLKNALATIGIICAILLIISIFASFTTGDGDSGTVSLNIIGILDFDFEATIMVFSVGAILVFMFFIVGIAGIREDFKFYLQHGMGRRTTYLSTLFSSLIVGAGWGLICQLLTLFFNTWAWFPATGLALPTENFFLGWLLHTLVLFFCWQFGTALSLIYYRLNKMGKIIFSVAGVALIIFVIPNIINNIIDLILPDIGDAAEIGAALTAFFGNPLNLSLIILALGAISALANFLLLRKAQARE